MAGMPGGAAWLCRPEFGLTPRTRALSMPTASRVAADLLRVLPRKQLSSLMGRLADLTTPPALVQQAIRSFVRVYGVELDEAIIPSEGFDSFDAFFTRALKA